MNVDRGKHENKRIVSLYVVTVLLAFLMFLNTEGTEAVDYIRLIAMVLLSTAIIPMTYVTEGVVGNIVLTWVGERSYSIFIWHQAIIAFYRYFISKDFTILAVIGIVILIGMLAIVSYELIEKRYIRIDKTKLFISSGGIAIFSTVLSMAIFLHGGVVRDVPELDIKFSEAHRGMHGEYNDRIRAMTDEFPDNGRINVLVVGNSFARDMANIILESEYADDVNILYAYGNNSDVYTETLNSRIQDADRILVYLYDEEIPDRVGTLMKTNAEIWGIGTKNFGQSNGIIYKNRFRDDYFEQTVIPEEEVVQDNIRLEKQWGNHYINLMDDSTNEDGTVNVFTSDNKFISQDCRHLERAGAEYFAEKLDLGSILE